MLNDVTLSYTYTKTTKIKANVRYIFKCILKFLKSFLKVKEVPFRVEFCGGRLLSLEKALFLLKKNIPFLFNFREQTLASFRTKNAEIEGEKKRKEREKVMQIADESDCKSPWEDEKNS